MLKALWGLVLIVLLPAAAGAGLWWRVEQPVESYATLIAISNQFTGTLMAFLDGIFDWNMSEGFVQRMLNVIIVDEFNGVMFGIIISSIFTLLWWVLFLPFRALGSFLKRKRNKASAENA